MTLLMGLSCTLSKEQKVERLGVADKSVVINMLKSKCYGQHQTIDSLHREGKEQACVITDLSQAWKAQKEVSDEQVYKLKELEETKISGR